MIAALALLVLLGLLLAAWAALDEPAVQAAIVSAFMVVALVRFAYGPQLGGRHRA